MEETNTIIQSNFRHNELINSDQVWLGKYFSAFPPLGLSTF